MIGLPVFVGRESELRKQCVLLADDDPLIIKLLEGTLRSAGYDTVCAGDGPAAVDASLTRDVDAVILDVVLPGFDGFEACTRIRAESSVPVLMLSVRGEPGDKVKALKLGADDYLTKPFSVDELVARVESVLRRASSDSKRTSLGVVRLGNVAIDFAHRAVFVDSDQIRLTPTEYALLQELASNVGKVLTHRDLLTRVWGPEYVDDTEYLHVFVSRLRRKLEAVPSAPQHLQTVAGVGYVLK